jgi:hypothetical protein
VKPNSMQEPSSWMFIVEILPVIGLAAFFAVTVSAGLLLISTFLEEVPADRAPLRLSGCVATDWNGSVGVLINLSRVSSLSIGGMGDPGRVIIDGREFRIRPSDVPELQEAFERCAGAR